MQELKIQSDFSPKAKVQTKTIKNYSKMGNNPTNEPFTANVTFWASFNWSILSPSGCKVSPWGDFCFKLGMINHYHNAKAPQSVYGSCKHSYCISECFCSLVESGACLWGLGRACLAYVRKPLFFSAAGLPLWVSKPADLQIYHINGEGTCKIRHHKQRLLCWSAFWEVLWVMFFLFSTYDRRSPW